CRPRAPLDQRRIGGRCCRDAARARRRGGRRLETRAARPRRRRRRGAVVHLRGGVHGARGTLRRYLGGVATSGLAIAFAELRIAFLAALFWWLGILVYGVITTLIVQRIVRDRLD